MRNIEPSHPDKILLLLRTRCDRALPAVPQYLLEHGRQNEKRRLGKSSVGLLRGDRR